MSCTGGSYYNMYSELPWYSLYSSHVTRYWSEIHCVTCTKLYFKQSHSGTST